MNGGWMGRLLIDQFGGHVAKFTSPKIDSVTMYLQVRLQTIMQSLTQDMKAARNCMVDLMSSD